MVGFALALIMVGLCYKFVWNNQEILSSEVFRKAWVHRANSIQKIQYSAAHFSGLEFDIIVKRNLKGKLELRVGHDDHKDNPLLAVCSTPDLKGKGIWFDVKNPSPETVDFVIKELTNFCNYNHIDSNQVVLESTNLEIAKRFNESKYKGAFYIVLENQCQLSEEDKRARMKLVKAKLTDVSTLSFDHCLLDAAETVFYESKYRFLSWNVQLYYNKDLDKVVDILEEHPKLDVFLIKNKTKHDR